MNYESTLTNHALIGSIFILPEVWQFLFMFK